MKRFGFIASFLVVSVLVLGFAAPAWAAAPRNAIVATGHVLSQMDETNPPNYPEEGWLDRPGLTDRVIEVLHLQITTDVWCPPMVDVTNNLDRYFDASLNPNPARDAFTRDWGRAMRRSGCS